MEASPRHCFFLGLGTQGREPWWVHGLDLLQHGQKSAASSSGQAAPWFPPVLPLQPSLLHPAAPSAPHIVCHSDRFKQTRLGLIRLRLRFLQRFAGAGQQKALGRQQTGGQARAGRDWIMGQGGEGKQGSPGPPDPCPGAKAVGAGCCPGKRRLWALCSRDGSRTRELLPPRAWRAAPTHPLPKPHRDGPKGSQDLQGQDWIMPARRDTGNNQKVKPEPPIY